MCLLPSLSLFPLLAIIFQVNCLPQSFISRTAFETPTSEDG